MCAGLAMIITPSLSRDPQLFQLVGRGHRAGGKGGGLPGGVGRVGRGKVNGQLYVVTSLGRKRMGKAPAVQSGRALPMGRCASPPWCIS